MTRPSMAIARLEKIATGSASQSERVQAQRELSRLYEVEHANRVSARWAARRARWAARP